MQKHHQGLDANGRLYSVRWCAGRASQRLAESSGMQAATIHRLLKWVPSHSSTDPTRSTADGKLDLASGGHFTFNEQNPLKLDEAGVEEEDWEEVDAVLIDEASMLDLPLAAALLQALPSHCQLVFVGKPCLILTSNLPTDLVRLPLCAKPTTPVSDPAWPHLSWTS